MKLLKRYLRLALDRLHLLPAIRRALLFLWMSAGGEGWVLLTGVMVWSVDASFLLGADGVDSVIVTGDVSGA